MKTNKELINQNTPEIPPNQEKTLESKTLTEEQVEELAKKLEASVVNETEKVLDKKPPETLLKDLGGKEEELKKQTKEVENQIKEIPSKFRAKVNELISKIKKAVFFTAVGSTAINPIIPNQAKGAEKIIDQENFGIKIENTINADTEENRTQQPDSTKISPEETPGKILDPFFGFNPHEYDENFKSGILPQNTDYEIVWPKLDTLDFARDGLPKDWRVKKAIFNRGKSTRMGGYMPKLSEEFTNTKKITQNESADKAKKEILSSEQGTMPKLKGHRNTFDEEGNYLPGVSYHGGSQYEGGEETEAVYDIESKNSSYDLNNLDKRTKLFFTDQQQLDFWKHKSNTQSHISGDAINKYFWAPVYLQIGDNIAKEPLSSEEIRGLPDFVFYNSEIDPKESPDAWFPLEVEILDEKGNVKKVNILTTAGQGEILDQLLEKTDWNDKNIKREDYNSQYEYTKAIIDKLIAEGIKSIIIPDAYKQTWSDGGKINFDDYEEERRWFNGGPNTRMDITLKKIPALPENEEYVKEIVKKMAGVESMFKHSKTPVEELMEKYPSLYSGLFDDPNIPFGKKGMTLKDLAKIENLTKKQQEYVNSEMIKAEVILESLELRDRTISYIKNPAYIDRLMHRNISNESFPKNYGMNDPRSQKYEVEYKKYSELRDLMVSDLYNIALPHIQEDRRGGIYMDLAQGISHGGMTEDQEKAFAEYRGGIFGTTTGVSPNLTQRHELQHILNRLDYSHFNFKGENPTTKNYQEIIKKEYNEFLATYKKDQYDPYWDEEDEMDADLAQLKYDIIYDPAEHSVGGIVNLRIDISQVANYLNAIEKYNRSLLTEVDPTMSRVLKIWQNSTPEQKAKFVDLMNKFN